jgi:hypothetical protein
MAARFGDPVAVRGEPVVVRVEILDDPGVVARVEVELRRDGEDAWRRAVATRDGRWWTARFTPEVWSPPPGALFVRATALGARGGVLLELGRDAPLALELLEPREAARRREALARSEALLRPEADDELEIAALVGLETRLADRARARALLGVEVPLARSGTLTLRVTVGPAFDPPAGLEGGALGVGLEAGARLRSDRPVPGRVTTYAGPRVGVELRLPGVDAGLGAEAGVHYGLSTEVALEVGLVAAARLLRLEDAPSDWALGFTGGLRAGIRLGGARS